MLPAMTASAQEPLHVQLQYQRESERQPGNYVTALRKESWKPSETAIIVCDTWDLHHCLNAVRRLEQFAPRLNDVLIQARKQGVTIIHAPSDCMDAYSNHPARARAISAPTAQYLPYDIACWCSAIPAEEAAVYPIDQSDGGEDDDPDEHAKWQAQLKSMGRNPATPWKQQSPLITIDENSDYISDRGEEVWNILQHKGINNVILAGVHTNMCVLGRPFGLRQMARNGKNVVLMRDLTDTMYNPQSWPYVSHFEGTRRVIAHVERFVCPTITSNQLIGGQPFRFQGDSGSDEPTAKPDPQDYQRHWTTVTVPHVDSDLGSLTEGQSNWYRSVVRIPEQWLKSGLAVLVHERPEHVQAWWNGRELASVAEGNSRKFEVPTDAIEPDDANLLVLRFNGSGDSHRMQLAPLLRSGTHELPLRGQWQFRIGADPRFSSMPLPAKFGGSADVVFSPAEPLWTPRPLTRVGEFTPGIEGPACDRDGNVFAVNYGSQGTIGRVTPSGDGELFIRLPPESIGNGIRFAPDGTFFVADYTGHNVLRVDPVTRKITVHAHSDQMNQPNDLAIAPDGKTLYASDPNWSQGTGQLWRIDDDGSLTRLAENMGTTNGIEVSPDGKTLYVNESKQRNVWAFTINADRTLGRQTSAAQV